MILIASILIGLLGFAVGWLARGEWSLYRHATGQPIDLTAAAARGDLLHLDWDRPHRMTTDETLKRARAYDDGRR